MNTLEDTPAVGPVTSLKSILATGELPDDYQKQLLVTFLESLESLESKAPTAAVLPSQPDITDNSERGPPPIDRLVSMKELPDLTGFSRRSILRMIAEGTFPQPIRINARCNRWRMSVVQKWINELEAKTRGAECPVVCQK